MSHAITRNAILPSVHVSVPQERANQVFVTDDGGGPQAAVTRKFLKQHPEWHLEDEKEQDWSKFHGTVLDACYGTLHSLKSVAAAPTFTGLTVLCLKETGLADIMLLESCRMLVHLDLSSNEISHVPCDDFWTSFPDMLVLLLHGNKISDWKAVSSVSKAPRLTFLTLFFNPVCKNKLYRTFTTNCCASLRGLDFHAVSDEEVVEGFRFPSRSRWRTCSSILALPRPLYKSLTDLHSTWRSDMKSGPGSHRMQPVHHLDQHDRSKTLNRDANVLGSVLRRVRLLEKFHARNSPVIISQRQVRRFIKRVADACALVKIQSFARRCLVGLRAANALRDVLRAGGELHLVQKMITPSQVRGLVSFQRRMAGRFRMRVLTACARRLERFMLKVEKRFAALVDCLGRSNIGGIVVASSSAGELAAAVTKALMISTPGQSWDEASGRALAIVSVVPNCRLLRPFSYVDTPDWPVLDGDIRTDGLFITQFAVGERRRVGIGDPDACSLRETEHESQGSFGGLRETHAKEFARRRRAGIFGVPRISACKITRRGVAVRRLNEAQATANFTTQEQLWVYRSTNTRMIARVICTLRNRSGCPVPYMLERDLFRCASATRIQAIWRGFVLRWNLLEPLASCMIVTRAGVCIQRWWRNLIGLKARLRLSRRLWALASAITSPTLYMELDVYFALTRDCGRRYFWESVVFIFLNEKGVATVNTIARSPLMPHEVVMVDRRHSSLEGQRHRDTGIRELPLWAKGNLVPQVSPPEAGVDLTLPKVGALLTEGVELKRVVWPEAVAPRAVDVMPRGNESRGFPTVCIVPEPDCGRDVSLKSASTDIWANNLGSNTSAEPRLSEMEARNVMDADAPVNFGPGRAQVEMLELTFSSSREARSRAILLALATEEPGVLPNRPIAQLMTVGMLRRAAAGVPGQASPTLRVERYAFERGDDVEVLMWRLLEGHEGIWKPGVVHRKTDFKLTYQVTLQNGAVETNVSQSRLRPYDRTGNERSLVEISHLPSRWKRTPSHLLTPADRLEMELLRRSLSPIAPIGWSALSMQPVHDKSVRQAGVLSPCHDHYHESDVDGHPVGEPHNIGQIHGRGLIRRPGSCQSPSRHEGARTKSIAPRWAGSQLMATARRAGGLAAAALEKVAKAAAAADEAAAASTWVPGNRFRRDLERLVSLTAREKQVAIEEKDLRSKRDAVLRAKTAAHEELSPRDRLERLKAAEIAVFRRENEELKKRADFDIAFEKVSRSANVTTAREYMRTGQEFVKASVEKKLAQKMTQFKQEQDKTEEDRQRVLERNGADAQEATAMAIRRRFERDKQAARRAESNEFMANASQLERHMGRHATASHKKQHTGILRRWVKGQKDHEEEIRRRMLQRVEALQERKRREVSQQRRMLAARGRARVVMDESVIRHRLGQPVPAEDELASDVMHVLRPKSKPCGQDGTPGKHDASCSGEHDECDQFRPRHGEDGNVGNNAPENINFEYLDTVQQTVTSDEGAAEVGRQGTPPPTESQRVAEAHVSTSQMDRRAVPSKPNAPRLHPRQRRSRTLCARDPGKTVVVLASVPSVAAEPSYPNAKAVPAIPSAVSKSSFSLLSSSMHREGGGKGGGGYNRRAPAVLCDDSLLPWPLGRRCWKARSNSFSE